MLEGLLKTLPINCGDSRPVSSVLTGQPTPVFTCGLQNGLSTKTTTALGRGNCLLTSSLFVDLTSAAEHHLLLEVHFESETLTHTQTAAD